MKTNAAAAAANPNLGSARLFGARAAVDFRSLLFDRDPRNTRIAERYLQYFLQLEARPFRGGLVFARTSATQTFVVEEGDSAFQLDDSAVGFSYTQTLELKPINRGLSLTYTGMINFPTSRVSVNLNPFIAPELRVFAYLNVIQRLDFGMLAAAQYRFHQYAERAGPGGGMNDRLRFAARPFLNYTVWEFPGIGDLYVSAGVSMSWRLRYPSRDSYMSPASDPAPWAQVFGWDASVGFATLQSRLFVTAGIQQGGAVMRDGMVSPRFLQADETEIAFGVLGRY